MWPNPQFSTDLVTFTKEILNRTFDFLSDVLRGEVLVKMPTWKSWKKDLVKIFTQGLPPVKKNHLSPLLI